MMQIDNNEIKMIITKLLETAWSVSDCFGVNIAAEEKLLPDKLIYLPAFLKMTNEQGFDLANKQMELLDQLQEKLKLK